jgi:hypothetical protein
MIQATRILYISTFLLIASPMHAYCKDDAHSSPSLTTCLISATKVGPIQLGVTLDEAKKSFPTATFSRTSDGDGVALVSVKVGREELMTLYADEEDSEAPINWSKKITNIETFSALCHMENGIHPESGILEVEKILGKTRKIQKSEIESREYIEFTTQPKSITFRLDYTGIFDGGAMTTKMFNPEAKIFSISISSRP